jgi:LacI family transcriptional regulator
MGIVLPGEVEPLLAKRVPVVNVSQAHGPVPFPSVLPDNRLAGRLAVHHLVERHYVTLYFAPRGPSLAYSVLRGEGARDAAGKTGCRFEAWQPEAGWTDPETWEPFLKRIAPPAGVVAADDTVASAILEAAVSVRLRVPEQLAVVGITNDAIACETAAVPLSSVDLDPEEIGDRAARLLVRLIKGRREPKQPVLVPPRGVVVRVSSDAFATNDRMVAAILRHARENLAEGVSVNDLARKFNMSRRQLNRMLAARLGMTPLSILQRLTIERAKQLLIHSGLSISEVAAQCGYDSPSRFGVLFRRIAGATPSRFRNPKTGGAT